MTQDIVFIAVIIVALVIYNIFGFAVILKDDKKENKRRARNGNKGRI